MCASGAPHSRFQLQSCHLAPQVATSRTSSSKAPTWSLSFSRNEMRSLLVPVTVNVAVCHDGARSPLPLRFSVTSLVLFQYTSSLLLGFEVPGRGECWNDST